MVAGLIVHPYWLPSLPSHFPSLLWCLLGSAPNNLSALKLSSHTTHYDNMYVSLSKYRGMLTFRLHKIDITLSEIFYTLLLPYIVFVRFIYNGISFCNSFIFFYFSFLKNFTEV